MTIEPHHARTVYIPSAMPPKPQPRELRPVLSMAEEARLVRRRYAKTFGSSCPRQTGNDANRERKEAAEKARAVMSNRIAALLRERGPLRSKEIQDATGASQNHTRVVLNEMLIAGRVSKGRANGASLWGLA